MTTRARRTPRRRARAAAIAAMLGGCAPEAAGVVGIEIGDPASHWVDGGFVRMQPVVHLPSSAPGREQVEVWLRLPDAGDITTVVGDDGIERLAYPPGTIADRVEYVGDGDARRVVDVRGATIDDDGRRRWHVLRPDPPASNPALKGVQWPCDDPRAQEAATAAMVDVLRRHASSRGVGAGRRDRELASFVAKNDCGGCHVRARPDARFVGEYGVVHRGTDASGFFVPQTVLSDAIPLEDYGRFDPNVEDPAVRIDCGDAPVERDELELGRVRVRCADGRVPIGRVDWARARDADADRVHRICSARAALVNRFDDHAAERISAGLRPCTE